VINNCDVTRELFNPYTLTGKAAQNELKALKKLIICTDSIMGKGKLPLDFISMKMRV